MDTAGVRMQVLSVPGPGAEIVAGPNGIAIAREYNDRMDQLISALPERFAALAHLPIRTPEAAADELERAVVECGLKGALISGTIDGKFLDARASIGSNSGASRNLPSTVPLINAPLSPHSTTARSNSSAAAAGLLIGRWANAEKRSGASEIS